MIKLNNGVTYMQTAKIYLIILLQNTSDFIKNVNFYDKL